MKKVAILGAGLTGRLLALLLADLPERFQVSLFEQSTIDDNKTTGMIAAAMVAPVAESVNASKHITHMGQCALEMWPELLHHLELGNLYSQHGTLVVAHRQDVADLQHFQQRIDVNVDSVKPLSPNEIMELEPELTTPFSHGLWLRDEAHIANYQLYQRTAKSIEDSDIELLEHCRATLAKTDNQWHVVTEYCDETPDIIIDCRGLGARQQWQHDDTRLRGVRGEIIRVVAPDVHLDRPVRLMHPRYPLYIVPKGNGHFVIGATEIESEDDKRPTVRSAMELLSAAYSLHKGFAEAEIVAISAACRPTLSDNEPSIYLNSNLIQVNGLYRHGYLVTPYIIDQVLHQLDVESFTRQRIPPDEVLIKR